MSSLEIYNGGVYKVVNKETEIRESINKLAVSLKNNPHNWVVVGTTGRYIYDRTIRIVRISHITELILISLTTTVEKNYDEETSLLLRIKGTDISLNQSELKLLTETVIEETHNIKSTLDNRLLYELLEMNL